MYRALYRKWRPQRFADVVGQTAIVTALQNQISAGRIGHAYLFTGTRGTGKTTCAKIFAKAVNCLDTSSPDPCGECEICKGIDSGSVMDIIEMDAASNNGVDDIRDLRDEVAYLPSVCKYKVYIIDEVHMLSTAAFNALLKTMEEPPEHVIFILATTEVQKVPVTILSRCQRYDFTRITADDIAGRLLYVAGQEKIELDENAAQLIGRLADGAMRDALSILDTCAGVDNHVDEALVRRMAGVTDRGYLFEISDAIAAGDSVTALEKIAELRQKFDADLSEVRDSESIEKLRVSYLGKKGSVTELLKGLKDLSGAEKKEFGQTINTLKREVDERITAHVERIRQEEEDRLVNSAEQYDVTLPMDTDCGSYHPITLVQRELEEIFASMGFTIEDYREVVTDYNCFEALNIPKHHPARDMQDTYYLDNGQLLKTHTSAAQNTIMKKYGAPLRAIFPGRCFRNESTDASHENTFFQMEGIMIDKDISISNLIYFMKTMLSKVFKQDVQVRLRPGFFPFVEPGFELDISCHICGGKGCSTCHGSGWIELCPCGMIHPNVLRAGGIDPDEYTGFAFGLGLTRLAMMRYGIKDIRDLNSGNLKVLSQFNHE